MSSSVNHTCDKRGCRNSDVTQCFCADCFSDLEDKLESAEGRIEELEAELKSLQEKV